MQCQCSAHTMPPPPPSRQACSFPSLHSSILRLPSTAATLSVCAVWIFALPPPQLLSVYAAWIPALDICCCLKPVCPHAPSNLLCYWEVVCGCCASRPSVARCLASFLRLRTFVWRVYNRPYFARACATHVCAGGASGPLFECGTDSVQLSRAVGMWML